MPQRSTYDAIVIGSGPNEGGHLLFGVDRSHVRSVMVAGRWVVRDRRVVTLDAEAVLARAREAAPRLWQRMESL